ncbi:MAG: helix-turn-helix domain-containing protein [Oscillospiraceae bacterium]|nr:helix-turn-helix domain-containing protein [Oscillospiraceae bacterium]
MNTIGSRIAAKRKALGMTQEDLAKILGVSSQAVSKWENDVSCPDITLLPQLANALNCTTDALLSGKEDQVRLVPEAQRKNPEDLVLRIKVLSAHGDKVRVNLPFGLLKALSGAGVDIAAQYSGVDALKGIDMEKILEMVENGTVGKIVEVESADGDTVEIVVE